MTAFLFDLDGTLNDSVPLITYVSQLTYHDLGLERTVEQIKKTIGVPLVQTGEEIYGPGNGDIYRLAYQKNYREQAEHFPPPGLPRYPGYAGRSATKRRATGPGYIKAQAPYAGEPNDHWTFCPVWTWLSMQRVRKSTNPIQNPPFSH